MGNKLEGRVALITGAAGGMGEASAVTFAAEGAKVVIADIKDGTPVAEKIKAAGGEATYIRTDLSEEKDIVNMIEKTVDIYGQLDILYNNAGISLIQPLEEFAAENFDKYMAVNVRSHFLAVKYALPYLYKSAKPNIMATLSMAAVAPFDGVYIYGATKAAALHFYKMIAKFYGFKGIRVNTISPGVIDTPLNIPFNFDQVDWKPIIPMGKQGLPQDIANLALFLASDDSSYITGENILCDGGYTMING
jgi:NAD(P)-dependent dehydrogenase (short-subunit alcohol dehydrogenase family)